MSFPRESDSKLASNNFLKSTGFANTNEVKFNQPTAPMSAGKTALQFKKSYNKANPHALPYTPGQVAPLAPHTDITPNRGLVPGHLPLKDDLNPTITRARNEKIYPSSDAYWREPYVKTQPKHIQDWRAVGVGPESNRTAPGFVGINTITQGYAQPEFTGKFKDVRTTPDGPFPKIMKMHKDLYVMQKVEKMIGGEYKIAAGVMGAGTITAAVLWANSTGGGDLWGIVALLMFAITVVLLYQDKLKGTGETTENQVGEEEEGKALPTRAQEQDYEAKHTYREDDTSQKQVYLPRRRGMKDAKPYPKRNDTMTDTITRLTAQGMDVSNLEGPRADYWYKRGPTPENRPRVKPGDLMRDPSTYNMDANRFDEYMARLDGEAPDQFYRAHPYLPFSANWDYRQEINDMNTKEGVSTQPGPYNRKWTYKDPKIQQGGAKTMHTKEPPPGSVEPLMKVHPWLEPKDNVYSQPFNADDYIEYMTASTRNEAGKVLPRDGGRILQQRVNEDQYFRNMRGEKPKEGDKLPRYLQPVPTSRDSNVGDIAGQREAIFNKEIGAEQDRTIKYVKGVQGGGLTVLPPMLHNPPQVPPNDYSDNPPYAVNYARPNLMPSPALADIPMDSYVNTPSGKQLANSGVLMAMNQAQSMMQNKPHKVVEPTVSKESKAQAEFEGVFTSDTKVENEVRDKLIKEAGNRL